MNDKQPTAIRSPRNSRVIMKKKQIEAISLLEKGHSVFVTGPGGILVLDSTGTHLGTISVPIPATNLAFGPKEKELFITARSTVYRVSME